MEWMEWMDGRADETLLGWFGGARDRDSGLQHRGSWEHFFCVALLFLSLRALLACLLLLRDKMLGIGFEVFFFF